MKIFLTQRWNELLDKFEEYQKDIYFYEEYVKMYEDSESEAFCVICEEKDSILLMPFLRRKIEDYFDFETAYGYGGPIFNTKDNVWICHAINEVKNFLMEEKYICGFVRFHPLIKNVKQCTNCIDTFFDRNTIIINTEMKSEEIWMRQISSKNRNMIRKAAKNGLTYKAEYDFKSMNEFIELYNATMERLHSDEFYFFKKDYYKNFIKYFRGRAFLGTVRKDDKLICAALFMYSEDYGHYHLEGSDHNYSNLGANNLLLWKTALEFQKLNVKEFHLGGGYDSTENNSLYKFKRAFSKESREFHIGKVIFNQGKYDTIKSEWIKGNPDKVKRYENLLLCYRY